MNRYGAYEAGRLYGKKCCIVSLERAGVLPSKREETPTLQEYEETCMIPAMEAGFENEWRCGHEYGYAQQMYENWLLNKLEDEKDVLPEGMNMMWLHILRGNVGWTLVKEPKSKRVASMLKKALRGVTRAA